MNHTVTIPDNIVMITGPRIIGYILHFMLFGVLSLQVYLYANAFPRDIIVNKTFVFTVYILEVVQSAMMTATAFKVFAVGYGEVPGYDAIGVTWSLPTQQLSLVGFLAQSFYAYRLTILSRSYWVAGTVLLLAAIHLGGAIATAAAFKDAGRFTNLFGQNYLITVGLWNGGGALCDLIICISMAYYLTRCGSVGFQSTQIMLRRLIRLVIETGMVTAAVAILNFILSLMPHHQSISEATSEILAEVYANSMMVVLNIRIRTITNDHDMPASRPQGGKMAPNSEGYGVRDGIRVTTEEIVFPDDEISITGSTAGKLVEQMAQISQTVSAPSRPKSHHFI